MSARRIAAIALSGALVAGGAGAAVAAVTKKDGAEKAEQAILDDAAARLNVTPDKLREALAAAEAAQIDQAVKAGKLTQKQADALKAAHAKSGRVLGPLLGPGGPHVRGGFGPGGPGLPGVAGMRHGLLDDVADALGTTPAKLFAQLRAGKSIADVAKAGGKTLDDVRSAVKAKMKARLDKAVAAGDLTQKQADAMLARIDEKLAAIGTERGLRKGLRRHGRHPGGKPHAGTIRPGGMLPDDEAPALAPPPYGVFS